MQSSIAEELPSGFKDSSYVWSARAETPSADKQSKESLSGDKSSVISCEMIADKAATTKNLKKNRSLVASDSPLIGIDSSQKDDNKNSSFAMFSEAASNL